MLECIHVSLCTDDLTSFNYSLSVNPVLHVLVCVVCVCVHACVCARMCVCERERERETKQQSKQPHLPTLNSATFSLLAKISSVENCAMHPGFSQGARVDVSRTCALSLHLH